MSDDRPLFPDVGVLGVPYHEWGAHWMTPHHVLARLARYFRVLWLDPAPHWRDLRMLSEQRKASRALGHAMPASFAVRAPTFWSPELHRPAWLGAWLARRRLRAAWAWLRARGCRRLVLYVWHPRFARAVEERGFDLSLYQIDDEYSFSPELPEMSAEERWMIQSVDRVLAISPGLIERKSGINPHTIFMPEGVDYALYANPVAEPADLASIPRPRIGYTGVLKRHLDWSLLRDLARLRPDWSFVFVGPVVLPPPGRVLLDEMAGFDNVYLLGPKSVHDLAAYPQHFDVCIMPYLVDGYTNNIYPLKLHEYLASGRPVVGSPIRSLQDFRRVIALAGSVDQWQEAIAFSLTTAAADAAAAAARRAVARDHDWSEIIYRIAHTICDGLGPDYSARLSKITQSDPTAGLVRASMSRPK